MEISKLSSTSLHWKYTLRLCYRTPAPIGLAQWFQYHSASVVCPRTYNIMMEGLPQSIFSRIHFLTSLKCCTYFWTFLWILNYLLNYLLALLNATEMTRRLSILKWWGNREGLPEFDHNVWLLGLQWLHCRTVIAFILPLRAITALLQRDWFTSAHASPKCHNSYLYSFYNHILPETSAPFLFYKHGNDNFCGCVCICGSLFSLCQYY